MKESGQSTEREGGDKEQRERTKKREKEGERKRTEKDGKREKTEIKEKWRKVEREREGGERKEMNIFVINGIPCAKRIGQLQ